MFPSLSYRSEGVSFEEFSEFNFGCDLIELFTELTQTFQYLYTRTDTQTEKS